MFECPNCHFIQPDEAISCSSCRYHFERSDLGNQALREEIIALMKEKGIRPSEDIVVYLSDGRTMEVGKKSLPTDSTEITRLLQHLDSIFCNNY